MADALHRASALWRFAVTPNGKLPFPDPFPVRILPHPRIETKKNPNTGFFFVSAPAAGFEPATKWLTATCATTALRRNKGFDVRNWSAQSKKPAFPKQSEKDFSRFNVSLSTRERARQTLHLHANPPDARVRNVLEVQEQAATGTGVRAGGRRQLHLPADDNYTYPLRGQAVGCFLCVGGTQRWWQQINRSGSCSWSTRGPGRSSRRP